MTRVAEASGDTIIASRTLRLYSQVVGKARQAGEMDSTDTDENWVTTLVAGARMLCRVALEANETKGERGIEAVREAAEMVKKARDRLENLDVKLKASVELADGICTTVLAIKR
jgi:hypothetical protein